MTDLLREAPRHGLRVFLLIDTRDRDCRSRAHTLNPGHRGGGVSPRVFLKRRSYDHRLDTSPGHILYRRYGQPQAGTVDGEDRRRLEECNDRSRSFDVISGAKRRAPSLLRKLGLEWLFRLISEPRRLLRMTALPKFAALVLLARMNLTEE